MSDLGSNLKLARQNNNITQLSAAKKLGITNGALSGYERNYRKPEPEMIIKMAKLYEVSTDSLLGLSNHTTEHLKNHAITPQLALHKNISDLRKEKKMSQAELAKILNVSSSTVAMWETGKRSIKNIDLKSIADFFNVSTDYLLGRNIENTTFQAKLVLSKRLSELRKRKKLTQQRLAEKIGITRDTLSNYETGRREPDYNTLILFADFFHVSTDYLLGKENVENLAFENLDRLTPEDLSKVKKYIELVKKQREEINEIEKEFRGDE